MADVVELPRGEAHHPMLALLDADRAVAQLQADPDVASAELDQEVQML